METHISPAQNLMATFAVNVINSMQSSQENSIFLGPVANINPAMQSHTQFNHKQQYIISLQCPLRFHLSQAAPYSTHPIEDNTADYVRSFIQGLTRARNICRSLCNQTFFILVLQQIPRQAGRHRSIFYIINGNTTFVQ